MHWIHLQMTTLGWVRHGTDLTEKDMKLVVNATLQALAKLHAAHLVHRDLRLDNILWKSESEPFLADLELVARENQKLGVRITLAHYLFLLYTPWFMWYMLYRPAPPCFDVAIQHHG